VVEAYGLLGSTASIFRVEEYAKKQAGNSFTTEDFPAMTVARQVNTFQVMNCIRNLFVSDIVSYLRNCNHGFKSAFS
jgi:hypothetical protein